MNRKITRMQNPLRGWCSHVCNFCQGDLWVCHSENGMVRDQTWAGFYIENGQPWIFNGEDTFWDSDQSDDEANVPFWEPKPTIPAHRVQEITVKRESSDGYWEGASESDESGWDTFSHRENPPLVGSVLVSPPETVPWEVVCDCQAEPAALLCAKNLELLSTQTATADTPLFGQVVPKWPPPRFPPAA